VVGGIWDGSVQPGTPFSATLVYRATSSESYPPGTVEARYRDVLVSASFSAGNYDFSFTVPYPGFSPTIQIFDNINFAGPVDGYSWFWETPTSQYGIQNPFIQGWLLTTDLSTVTSPALEIQEFPISRFNRQSDGQLDGYDAAGNYQAIVFHVTDYLIEPVPEPGSATFLSGFFLIWALRRCRGFQASPEVSS
jgi:hypothetical protein